MSVIDLEDLGDLNLAAKAPIALQKEDVQIICKSCNNGTFWKISADVVFCPYCKHYYKVS